MTTRAPTGTVSQKVGTIELSFLVSHALVILETVPLRIRGVVKTTIAFWSWQIQIGLGLNVCVRVSVSVNVGVRATAFVPIICTVESSAAGCY